jgi:hypothetical protein
VSHDGVDEVSSWLLVNGSEASFEYILENSDADETVVDVVCWNGVSNVTGFFPVVLQENVTLPDIKPVALFYSTQEPAFFAVSVASGSHLTYSIDFGDDSPVEYFNNSDPLFFQDTFIVSHQYSDPDNFTLTVTASNKYTTATNYSMQEIIIQDPVLGLEMTVVETIVGFPDGYVRVSIRPNTTIDPPTNPWCQWTVDNIPQKPFFGSQLASYTIERLEWYFSRNDALFQHEVNFTCWNFVSQQNLSTKLDVVEYMEGIELLPSANVSTPGDSINFTAVLTNGSSVVYTFDFGDGDTLVMDSPEMFASAQPLTVQHTYNSTGNYSCSLRATNPLDPDVGLLITLPYDIVIQNAITDLMFRANNKTIWPPGNINLTLVQHNSKSIKSIVLCT